VRRAGGAPAGLPACRYSSASSRVPAAAGNISFMNIREADAGDTEGIAALVRKCCALRASCDPARYELTADVIREYRIWFGHVAEDPRSLLLVAEEGDAIVGFLIAVVKREMPIYKLTEYALIQEMWIEPEHDPAGAGPAGAGPGLIAKAASLLGAMDVRQIRIEVAAPDERLRRMLESAGFRVCSIDLLMDIPPRRTRRRNGSKPAASDAGPAPT
jgi:hypothetical protein